MNHEYRKWILQQTGAKGILSQERIQTLWSGYGEILRLTLEDSDRVSVIVKHVKPPSKAQHSRGWHSTRSHLRKLKSYQVETAWYHNYSQQCNTACRIPECYGSIAHKNEWLILLEDLNQAGYPLRKQSIDDRDLQSCLQWLAKFHATFLGVQPTGLWQQGAYWHLETRPDELDAMQEGLLKNAASWIDQQLDQAGFKTLIHGDAKLANFCFSTTGSVAAVDFQYIGRGCGMIDLAYFLGSCLDQQGLEHWHPKALDIYFESLCRALKTIPHQDFQALENEWRKLYPFAWADFQRFLSGWMPEHPKVNAFSDKMVQQVLAEFH